MVVGVGHKVSSSKMKRTLFWLAFSALGAYALGALYAFTVVEAPLGWLAPAGRAPQLAAFLALGPIALVGLAAIVVKVSRKWRSRSPTQQDSRRAANDYLQ